MTGFCTTIRVSLSPSVLCCLCALTAMPVWLCVWRPRLRAWDAAAHANHPIAKHCLMMIRDDPTIDELASLWESDIDSADFEDAVQRAKLDSSPHSSPQKSQRTLQNVEV